MMFNIYLPVVIGDVMLILAKPIGVAFCRLVKANWRMLTFGKTDMARYYSEQRAPITMRIVGAGLLVLGDRIPLRGRVSLWRSQSTQSIVPSEGVSISSVWKSGPQLEAFAQEGI